MADVCACDLHHRLQSKELGIVQCVACQSLQVRTQFLEAFFDLPRRASKVLVAFGRAVTRCWNLQIDHSGPSPQTGSSGPGAPPTIFPLAIIKQFIHSQK